MNTKTKSGMAGKTPDSNVAEKEFASSTQAGLAYGSLRRRCAAIGLAVMVAVGVASLRAEDQKPGMSAGTHVKEAPAPTSKVQELDIRPVHRGVTYGGALHDIAKADHPWQAVNPWAPKRYGSGETNLVRDPLTKQPRGVALFSLSW